MKKISLLILLALVATSVATAQSNPSGGTPPFSAPVYSATAPNLGTLPYGVSNTGFNGALGADVLGAHNGYGRGCVMCHAPHGGAQGNNAPGGTNPVSGSSAPASSDTGNGSIALWGENLAPYYGATVQFVSGTTVTLPASASGGSAGEQTVLLCLSCHDGALTRPAMMAGWTVEALPIVGGSAPTLFGATTTGNSALTYINEHPVGATPGLYGGATSGTLWGCAIATTGTAFSGTTCASSSTPLTNFKKNYPASIWNAGASGGLVAFATTVNGVTCTTCHNQHTMTVFKVGTAFYPTMFFIRGEYMPSTGGNSVAQFCRNCHSGEANEENGLTSVPTT